MTSQSTNDPNHNHAQQNLIRVVFKSSERRIYLLVDKKVRLLEVAKLYASFLDIPPDQIIFTINERLIKLDDDFTENKIEDVDIIDVKTSSFPSRKSGFLLTAIDSKLKLLRKLTQTAVFMHSLDLQYTTLLIINYSDTLGMLKDRYQLATSRKVETVVRIGKNKVTPGKLGDDTQLKDLYFSDDLTIEVKLSANSLPFELLTDHMDKGSMEISDAESSSGSSTYDDTQVEIGIEAEKLLEINFDEETSDEYYDMDDEFNSEEKEKLNVEPPSQIISQQQTIENSLQVGDQTNDLKSKNKCTNANVSSQNSNSQFPSARQRFKISISSLMCPISVEGEVAKQDESTKVPSGVSTDKDPQDNSEVFGSTIENVLSDINEQNGTNQKVRASNSAVPAQSQSGDVIWSENVSTSPFTGASNFNAQHEKAEFKSSTDSASIKESESQPHRSPELTSTNADDTNDLPPGNQESAIGSYIPPQSQISTESSELSYLPSSLKAPQSEQQSNGLSQLTYLSSSLKPPESAQKLNGSSSQNSDISPSNLRDSQSSQAVPDPDLSYTFNFTGPIKMVRSLDGEERFRQYLKEYKAEANIKSLIFRYMNRIVKPKDTPMHIKALPNVANTIEVIHVENKEVTFAIRDVKGRFNQTFFRCKTQTRLAKPFDFYSVKYGLKKKNLQFSFAGRRLRRNDTLEDIELKGLSIIDVFILDD